jgi:hypothetical protein
MHGKLLGFVLVGVASTVAALTHAQLLTHRDLSHAMANPIAETAIDSCAQFSYLDHRVRQTVRRQQPGGSPAGEVAECYRHPGWVAD